MEFEIDSFGDLGLGRGLKPGAVLRNYDSDSGSQLQTLSVRLPHHEFQCPSCKNNRSQSLHVSSEGADVKGSKGAEEENFLTSVASKLKRWNKCLSSADGYETSKTAENVCDGNAEKGSVTEFTPNLGASNNVILEKLQVTQQEYEEMKQDLELCQMRLKAKYQATKILQKQLAFANREKEVSANRFENLNQRLIRELNTVRFELKCHESKLLESQENWSAKFDSICLENLRLVAAREEQTLQQRKLFAEKMALCRERDELLALLDICDRGKYESLRPASAESDPFDSFTSLELALLGACRCQPESQSPCSCVVTAACLKKEIAGNKVEMEKLRQERDDALAMADLYRVAFDDQLSRNRCLFKQMTEICKDYNSHSSGDPSSRCREKFKTPIARLFCKDGQRLVSSQSETSLSFPSPLDRSNGHKTDELMKLVEEMVIDKSEALVHQKFATRLLACRIKQLEEKLSRMHEEGTVFTTELDKTFVDAS